MRFSTFLPLALIGAATAAQAPAHVISDIVPRDLATVQRVINDADARIKALTTAVSGFNGDPTALVSASTALQSTIAKGVTDVTATTPLTLNEAIQLQSLVTTLQNDGNALISALNSKKDAFQRASLCTVVFQQAADLGKAGQSLIDAVVGKVPQETQQLAAQLASGFTTALRQSQQAFAPGNCTNANGQAGGGSGSASGTGSAGTTRPTGTPVTAAAGHVFAPVGLMCAIAAVVLVL